jgi:hypothetical protein
MNELLANWLFQLLRDPSVNAFLTIVNLYITIKVLKQAWETNGRLLKLEAWRTEHDKQDDQRHAQIVARLARVK